MQSKNIILNSRIFIYLLQRKKMSVPNYRVHEPFHADQNDMLKFKRPITQLLKINSTLWQTRIDKISLR